MAWFYLESLIALSILLGIVWWTMAPSRKPRSGATHGPDSPGDQESLREANRGPDQGSDGGTDAEPDRRPR